VATRTLSPKQPKKKVLLTDQSITEPLKFLKSKTYGKYTRKIQLIQYAIKKNIKYK